MNMPDRCRNIDGAGDHISPGLEINNRFPRGECGGNGFRIIVHPIAHCAHIIYAQPLIEIRLQCHIRNGRHLQVHSPRFFIKKRMSFQIAIFFNIAIRNGKGEPVFVECGMEAFGAHVAHVDTAQLIFDRCILRALADNIRIRQYHMGHGTGNKYRRHICFGL